MPACSHQGFPTVSSAYLSELKGLANSAELGTFSCLRLRQKDQALEKTRAQLVGAMLLSGLNRALPVNTSLRDNLVSMRGPAWCTG